MEHLDHILIVDDDREICELIGNYLYLQTWLYGSLRAWTPLQSFG
jgi:DNA-binding NtrC family response regulator